MKILAAITLLAAIHASAWADGWDYSNSTDPMTGKPISTARLASYNTLNLDFPYKGENRGRLLVRRHPTHGLDVIFTIDKGQLMCDSYRGCSATLRFDDGKPMTFRGGESADYDKTVMFLLDRRRFVEAARKAKLIRVQVTIYQAGDQVLEFNSSPPLSFATK